MYCCLLNLLGAFLLEYGYISNTAKEIQIILINMLELNKMLLEIIILSLYDRFFPNVCLQQKRKCSQLVILAKTRKRILNIVSNSNVSILGNKHQPNYPQYPAKRQI